jgi:hypothetical protein
VLRQQLQPFRRNRRAVFAGSPRMSPVALAFTACNRRHAMTRLGSLAGECVAMPDAPLSAQEATGLIGRTRRECLVECATPTVRGVWPVG